MADGELTPEQEAVLEAKFAAQLSALERQATQIESILNNLQGANGIDVVGSIITYNGPTPRP